MIVSIALILIVAGVGMELACIQVSLDRLVEAVQELTDQFKKPL